MSAPGISSSEKIQPLDVLAIAAHRDDVEQTCGGTLLKMAERGYRTGILDLTRGEMGTRGSAEDREREAAEAARILKTSWRGALDIPDGRVENTWENRLKVARVIREQQPRVVILPYWKGRHPDHYTCSTLGYEACFTSGLSKVTVPGSTDPPHRPYKILYASLYADVRPSFVVDRRDGVGIGSDHFIDEDKPSIGAAGPNDHGCAAGRAAHDAVVHAVGRQNSGRGGEKRERA